MRLPVMNGYETTRLIRKLPDGDKVKIIALTASAFKEQYSDILAAGCDDILFKPYKTHQIFDIMKRYLGVNFKYAEKTKSDETALEPIVDANKLAELPKEWLIELRQTALELNVRQSLKIIRRIEARDAALARELTTLVENFAFKKLLALLFALKI